MGEEPWEGVTLGGGEGGDGRGGEVRGGRVGEGVTMTKYEGE